RGRVRGALAAGRRDVVAPAPALHLVGTEALPRLVLVHTGDVAVLPLVERRVALGRNRAEAGGLEGEAGGLGRAHEDRRVQLVDLPAAELLAGGACLGLAARRQRLVHPAGEAILEVPLRLAVAKEDQLGHGSMSTPGLRMPRGSRAAFAAPSAAAKPAGRSRSYHGRWSRPTAWGWVIVPPRARMAAAAAGLIAAHCSSSAPGRPGGRAGS